MGTPKLLLDVGGKTVIARLLAALAEAGISNRLVVMHRDDTALKSEVAVHGGSSVVPEMPPADMRSSVICGLRDIRARLDANRESPNPDAPWMLIPADHPVVSASTVATLLTAAARQPGKILVPTYRGRRGHPTVFCWRQALLAEAIPATRGFNWILKECAAEVCEIEVDTETILYDLDTPEDYERLQSAWPS